MTIEAVLFTLVLVIVDACEAPIVVGVLVVVANIGGSKKGGGWSVVFFLTSGAKEFHGTMQLVEKTTRMLSGSFLYIFEFI